MGEPESKPVISLHLNLFADYFHFFLQDEEVSNDQPNDWGEQLVAHMVAVGPGIVGIGTARNTRVPVSVDLFTTAPQDDGTLWDQVVEVSVEVLSGRLVIAGSTEYVPEATHLSVTPGIYRIRSAASGLGTINEDGLRGEDQYHISLWPERAYRPLELLKQWHQ